MALRVEELCGRPHTTRLHFVTVEREELALVEGLTTGLTLPEDPYRHDLTLE